jgi:tetratricopeptide (TPR) repeat protein
MAHILGVFVLALLMLLTGCGKKDAPRDGMQMSDRPINDQARAPDVNMADPREVDLVEKLASARLAYKTYLEALQKYYVDRGFYDKQVWTDREMADLKKVRQYRYLELIDAPPVERMQARDPVAEANDIFADANRLYERNRRVPMVFDKDELRIALEKFRRLIKEYPTSDKVDDACFYTAEILKEFFDESAQAVEYYRLAYQADPSTPHPAHFQRAVILDFRLYRRDEAVQEYRAVLAKDNDPAGFRAKSNKDFAATRIRQLTTGVDHNEK